MAPLRTRIYIDGFNFYYGLLKRTRYKWLDVPSLFERQILPSILYRSNPNQDPVEMVLQECAVKYFTAPILESLASGPDSVSSQAVYHNALRKHSPGRISLIMGGYSVYPATQHFISEEDPNRQPRLCPKISVWKVEEKRTDVNMALHAYDDAINDEVDQVVIVTNDTDLTLALELIRKRCPKVTVGLVIPAKPGPHAGGKGRKANDELSKNAHWVRDHITDAELAAAQLPTVVPGGKKAAVKPDSWYPQPDLLAEMIVRAKPVLGSRSKIMKWANLPNPWMAGHKPIELIETEAGAATVFAYIDNYIQSFSVGVAEP